MKIKECLLLLCLLWGGMSRAQSASDTVPDFKNQVYPRYVTFLPVNKLDSVLAYANTSLVPVIFKVNKYSLKPNAQLDTIADLINRVREDMKSKLAYVWVGGSALPEGPVWWNKKLGHYRSIALANFLREQADLSEYQLRVENLAEDWSSVARMLPNTDIPHKEKILEIIATESDWDKRKSKIRAIDGSRTWSRLVQELFPPFRNARLAIVCQMEDFNVMVPLSMEPPVLKPDKVQSEMPTLKPGTALRL